MQCRPNYRFTSSFLQAQKPWSKRLEKVIKCKKDYHLACKLERTANNQENNAKNSSEFSPDQVWTIETFSGFHQFCLWVMFCILYECETGPMCMHRAQVMPLKENRKKSLRARNLWAINWRQLCTYVKTANEITEQASFFLVLQSVY